MKWKEEEILVWRSLVLVRSCRASFAPFSHFSLRQFKIYIFIIVGVRGLGKWENSTSKASHVCWGRIRIKVNGGGRKRGQKSERVELKNIFINPQNSSPLSGLPAKSFLIHPHTLVLSSVVSLEIFNMFKFSPTSGKSHRIKSSQGWSDEDEMRRIFCVKSFCKSFHAVSLTFTCVSRWDSSM